MLLGVVKVASEESVDFVAGVIGEAEYHFRDSVRVVVGFPIRILALDCIMRNKVSWAGGLPSSCSAAWRESGR